MKTKDQKRREALARWEIRKADCARLQASAPGSAWWWANRESFAERHIQTLRRILNINEAAA